MMNHETSISQIEALVMQNTAASLTYAALECRLAIERICYERLMLAHDYISHDDLKKWQPRNIIKTLVDEVDPNTAKTFTISVSSKTSPGGSPEPTLDEYQAMEFVPLGTQVGFDPDKLGKLWHALAKLALHVTIPITKDHDVAQYGSTEKIREKVVEALAEVKRIGSGNLISSGLSEQVSFACVCGTKNKRNFELLTDGKIISCIGINCFESYKYIAENIKFTRRIIKISCQFCNTEHEIPTKKVEKLRTDEKLSFGCRQCGEDICVSWQLMQTQKAKPSI